MPLAVQDSPVHTAVVQDEEPGIARPPSSDSEDEELALPVSDQLPPSKPSISAYIPPGKPQSQHNCGIDPPKSNVGN